MRNALAAMLALTLLVLPADGRAGGGGRTGGTSGGGSAPPPVSVPRYQPRYAPPYQPPSYSQTAPRSGSAFPTPSGAAGPRYSGGGIATLSWMVLLVLLLPIFAIGYFIMAFFRNIGLSQQAQVEREETKKAAAPVVARDPLEPVKARDASFDEQAFLEQTRAAFAAIQDGWEKRQLGGCRQYLTAETTQRFQTQIDDMRAKSERNVLENMVIDNARVVAAAATPNADSITVRFSATAVDYVIDEKTGRMVDGSMKPRPFVELWTFVRNLGTTSAPCASCGAPASGGAACGYCGNAGDSGMGWVLSGIEEVVHA